MSSRIRAPQPPAVRGPQPLWDPGPAPLPSHWVRLPSPPPRGRPRTPARALRSSLRCGSRVLYSPLEANVHGLDLPAPPAPSACPTASDTRSLGCPPGLVRPLCSYSVSVWTGPALEASRERLRGPKPLSRAAGRLCVAVSVPSCLWPFSCRGAGPIAQDWPAVTQSVSSFQVFFNGANVRQVDVPTQTGAFGILAAHVPTLQVLRPGLVVVHAEDGTISKYFGESGGKGLARGRVLPQAGSRVWALAWEE